MIMKKTYWQLLLLLVAFLSMSSATLAQGKEEIVEKKIEVKRFWDLDIEEGDKTPYLDREEYYNEQGELVEFKEFADKGKRIKYWMKYTFDKEGNLLEEITLGPKGEQVEKFVYKYEKGLRVERLTYDSKNRLKKRRTYEYQYRK